MPQVETDPKMDPTLDEMQSALHDRYSYEFDHDPFEAVADANAAIYWFAEDYRAGRGNLSYVAASSDYRPSMTEAKVPDNAREMYDELVRVFVS